MGKGHLPVIAKIQNPTTLGGVHIMGGRLNDGTIGSVTAGVGAVRITRAMLVSLRDQISAWLDKHPEENPLYDEDAEKALTEHPPDGSQRDGSTKP